MAIVSIATLAAIADLHSRRGLLEGVRNPIRGSRPKPCWLGAYAIPWRNWMYTTLC